MSELLYSIRNLFSDSGYLSYDGQKYYNIPLYQRGYKWQQKHVDKLLEDIRQFNHEEDKFYCLQNITIVPKGEVFNVVDGQQRLTTLSLILNYLGEVDLIKGKVRFPDNSIRKYSNKFLNEFVFENPEEVKGIIWEEFILDHSEYDHQDIYHMLTVLQSIHGWFDKQPKSFSKVDFRDKILDHVMVIMNQVSDDSNEEKIFGNLNSKRIPLDGADLIRAMLVTRVVYEEGKKETNVKNIVRVNERRVKIGWVIDQINNWWSLSDVSKYFSGFLSNQERSQLNTAQFNIELHPINLLYYLFAQSKGQSLSLEYYENAINQPTHLYKEIIKLHETLKDWFQDRDIYHYLGYLIFQDDTKFGAIWALWIAASDRLSFKYELKGLIRKSVSINDELIDFRNSDTNWYERNKRKLVQGLILMDVIHSLKNNQAFIPHSGFSKDANDIEHIFPQNPEKPKDKKSYVTFLNEHVVPKGKPQFKLDQFDLDLDLDETDYNKKLNKFIEKCTSSYKVHSIGNLVLLDSSLNRSISNSSYSYKRARVIDHFNKGNYIQPHTFHVFVRYFNDIENINGDFEHWSQKDIDDNLEKIASTIENFFNATL
jgi:uncharacterized protein with ParB-like and HNH nuclease domain